LKNKSKLKSEPLNSALNTGVEFEYRGSKTTGSKALSMIIGVLFNFVLTMAISLGGIFTFTTMFQVKYSKTLFFVIAIIFGLAINIVYQLPKKVVRYTLLALSAATVAIPLIFFDLTVSGFEYIRDFVLVGIAKNMLWTVPELSYTFTDAMKVDTTFLLTVFSILLITWISFFTVRKINFIFVFLLTFPLFELGAAFGMVPNHFCFAAMLAGWMGVFAMHSSTIIRKIKKRRRDKKKTKTTVAERKQTLISTIGIIVAIITFLTFSLGHFLVGLAGYNRPEDMKELRSDFKNYVSDLIDYILGFDNDGSLREGRLYQMGDRIIKDRQYMTVVSPLKEQSYLRGFIGGNYTGDSWAIPSIDPNYEWLNESFKSSGLYPQNMQGKAIQSIADRNTFVKNSAATITISNLRRKKDYAYTTYIPLISNDFNLSGDSLIEPKNKSGYSYNAYVDTGTLFTLNTSELLNDKEFSSIWKEYSNYVKYTYTQLPTGMAEVANIVEGLKNGTGYGYEKKGVAQSNIEIADRIREYLKANIEYSLTTPTLPEDADFVTWLLFENKKGYSAHYATAMAVMLRMADVPARYVEGYVLTPEDFANSTPVDEYNHSVSVTDVNAHAWIELYESNYGWIPIEATPGFFEGSLVNDIQVEQDTLDTPQGGESEEQEYQHNENSDLIIYDDFEQEIEPPELEIKEEEDENSSSFLKIVLSIIKYLFIFIALTATIFIIVLLIMFVILIIRRAIKLNILNKNINSAEYDKKILSIYKYYIRLLHFENIINTEQLPYLEFTRKIAEKSNAIDAEKHTQIMYIFLKYRFSNEALTQNEIEYLDSAINEYRTNSKEKLSREEKFQFMFIDNLG